MKNFIKNKLRVLLEGPLTRDTPANPLGAPDPKTASTDDFSRTSAKIANLFNQYGQDPYFQDSNEGDGIYMATVHTNGAVTIKTPNPRRKLTDADVGLPWQGTSGNLHVYVRAYRSQADGGEARTKSPANDAAIKTYIVFGREILDYVRQNMMGSDQYPEDPEEKKRYQAQTADKWKYKYDKLEKEKERKANKSTISIGQEKADIVQMIQDLTREKVDATRKRDRARAKELRLQIQDLKAKL